MEELRPGDPGEIGGYPLLGRLGEGGMGEVFLARTASGRPLALKTVHRDLSQEPGFAERFAREIRTNDRVRCPWTVSVVDFSPPGAVPQWLATEYVAAPSLGDWVRRHGPLGAGAVRALARELSAALVTVRAAGVVHRDIKPANVLLGPERPFLIDFGIARAVRDPRRTQTGTLIGTPGYLAPEQATGAVAEAPADVFSLAAVLVYAATGRGPFQDAGEELELPALLYRIVHEDPRLDGVPAELAALVRDCLAKEPGRRPTAEELRERLGPGPEDEWTALLPGDLRADTGRRAADLARLLEGSTAAGAPPAAGHPYAPGQPYPPTAPGTPPSPVPVATAGPGAFTPSPYAPTPYGPGPATPTPYGPAPGATPVPGTAPGGDGRGGRRSRLTAVVVAVAVLAVTGALIALLPWGGEGDDDKDRAAGTGSSGTPATSRTSPAPAPSGALAAGWLGTWTGTGPGTPDADGLTRARTGPFAVTVTLHDGAVGQIVGKQVSDVKEVGSGRNLGCTEALELRQSGPDSLVLKAATSHPTDQSATFECPRGNLYVVKLTAPGRMALQSEGAQSAGAPDALTRRP
ncbi:protein kinase [Streptomyces sp. NPDC089919]|uniref:serine/threonine-protein kinase n=1 Tax=Streptomyces sp. NPDC089919 TaxID=3155188 RepID=UPI00341E31E7